MLKLTGRDCINISMFGSTSPSMEQHVWMRPDNEGNVSLECWYRECKKPECKIKIGNMVHINVSMFGEDYLGKLDSSGNIPLDLIWAELRQFEVVDMKVIPAKYEWKPGSFSDHKRCIVILKEKDRQYPENDGQYWVFYDAMKQKYRGLTRIGLSKMGREYDDETINAAIEQNRLDNYGEWEIKPSLIMAPSSYVQRCWEYYVEHNFYNKTYAKGMAQTVYAFPDTDKQPGEETTDGDASGLILLAILWGFIPEGMAGVMYLILALFFSALFLVFNNSWLIILGIITIYWTSNVKLKTNMRNKIGK